MEIQIPNSSQSVGKFMLIYVGSILTSYIKEETRKFFLGHTDLNATNILIDDEGSITAIFDPELASTLLFHVAERYPLLG